MIDAALPDLIAEEIIAGLRAAVKHLPSKLLYDARGAQLFEQITSVDDYYLTRAELALLEAKLPAIARRVGAHARVIEPGSGAGHKTRMLLSALDRPALYIPIDVAALQLAANAASLREEYPALDVLPVPGDYTRPLAIPRAERPHDRTLVFFPGSTIGNFEPDEACAFLAELRRRAGPCPMILIGADTNRNRDELLRAYDDGDGVTAEFDLNVLAHLNATYRANFELDRFTHRAVWNAANSRIEMHLVSRRRQVVIVAGERFRIDRGEPIVTEHCYKHPPHRFEAMLVAAGWHVCETFVEPRQRMRLWLA